MICRNCKQAFNGSTGKCHLCGTEVLVPKPVAAKPIIEDDEVEVAPKPEKKKKAAGKK